MTKRKLHVCDSLPLPKRVSTHHSPKVCTAVRMSAWAYADVALVGYLLAIGQKLRYDYNDRLDY